MLGQAGQQHVASAAVKLMQSDQFVHIAANVGIQALRQCFHRQRFGRVVTLAQPHGFAQRDAGFFELAAPAGFKHDFFVTCRTTQTLCQHVHGCLPALQVALLPSCA